MEYLVAQVAVHSGIDPNALMDAPTSLFNCIVDVMVRRAKASESHRKR